MTAIALTKHELLQLKLLLRDIQLIQKMNSPFDNEAIEILSFKIIEHLNTDETLKEYHIVDSNEMVSSQTEISDEIFGQELFNYFTNQHNISLLQSEMHDIIDIVKKMEQTEISDAGKDTADYIDRHIIESMKELAREGFKPQVSEISDEEIWKAAESQATFAPSFVRGVEWFREQLKKNL